LVVISPATGFAQTRKRTATNQAHGGAAGWPGSTCGRRAGCRRDQDSDEVYLSAWGVAKSLEVADDAVKRNEASAANIDQAKQGKATVRASIQSVRERLDKLEIDFRATPELQRYYIATLAGVASAAANAEDLAAANQFDKAGRTLLDVVNHLTDVLLAMR
jgi:hypothetical protein